MAWKPAIKSIHSSKTHIYTQYIVVLTYQNNSISNGKTKPSMLSSTYGTDFEVLWNINPSIRYLCYRGEGNCIVC